MSRDFKIFLTIFIFILVLTGIIAAFYFLSANRIDSVMTRAGEKYQFGDVQDVKSGIEMYSSVVNNKQNPKDKVAEAAFKAADGYMLLSEKTRDPAKLEVALAKYQNLINNYSGSEFATKSYLRIAHINMMQGNYDTALVDLDVILTKYSDSDVVSEVYNQKGEIYYAIGNYEKALYYFNRNENMSSEYAVLGRARTYLKIGNTPKAVDIYEDFMKFNANSQAVKSVQASYQEIVYNYAFKLYSMKDYSGAVGYFRKLIQMFPDSPKVENAYYWIGECYYDTKNYPNAVASFNGVLENRKSTLKDPDALLKLGLCAFEQGDYYVALKHFNNIIDNYPSSSLYGKAAKWKEQTVREIKYQ